MTILNRGYLHFSWAPNMRKRPYKSLVRQRQASDTRRRIVNATRQLLQSEGYDGMTIEAIAQRAKVSAQSVYAIFKSKTGILIALLDQSTFGPDYDDVVRQALSASDPETRLRRAASVARQIRGAQSEAFDLMRGAGVVAPELAKLEQQRERLRYEREESMISFLRDAGSLRPGHEPQDRAGYLLGAYWRGCLPHAGAGAWVVASEIPRLASRHPTTVPAHSRKPGSPSGKEA